MEHAGKVALVTGASRGIGRSIAIALARDGADVVINFHKNQKDAEEVAERVQAHGRRAMLAQANVGDPDQVKSMVSAVVQELGGVDTLVNSAGIAVDNLLLALLPTDIEAVIRTNLLGTIFCTQAVAMHMIRNKRGRIINLSSSAASKPGRGQSNYAAAKGGVEAFTRAMAVELAPKNVLVNAIAPGVIETDMSERIRSAAGTEILNRLLLKRYGSVDEVAELAAFLASDKASYLTGEVIHLDGGLKMS